MFFKKPAPGIRKVIRTTDDEFPKNNESWAEFMVRKDTEGQEANKVGMIVVLLILVPWLVFLAFEAADKAMQ